MSISSADGSGPSAMIDPFSTPFFEPRYHAVFFEKRGRNCRIDEQVAVIFSEGA